MDISMIADNQAEAGVIATLMYHPDFILHSDYLKPGYFYNQENGCLYWAISELYKAGIDNIDALNISNMLNSNRAVKKKIAEYNITNIQEYIDMSKYAARHTMEEYKLLVKSVVTMAYKRELCKFAVEIQSQCYREETDLDTLNTFVNSKTTDLAEKFLIGNEIKMMGDVISDLWDEIVSERTENGVVGIPSKFPILSEYFTYEKTELVLLTARMKMGKSFFLMSEALFMLQHGIPVLYLDTEMSTKSFMIRAISALTGVHVKNVKNGRYSEEEAQKIEEARKFLENAPLCHMYIPVASDMEIYNICKTLKYKINLEVVFYDYIKSDDKVNGSSELSNALGARTNFLKNVIGGELDLTVISGAQKNREGMIADSDKIARYVSTVIDWRPKTSEEIAADGGLDYGNFALSIPINRNGPQTGEDEYISMHFNGDIARIEQAKQPQTQNTPFN